MASGKVEEDATSAQPLLGAVFDLDGTLLATEEAYLDAYTLAAESFGKEYTWDTVHCKIVGKAEREGAQIVIDCLGLSITPDEFLERRDRYLNDLLREARPLPGAMNVVRHMKACCSKIALATSSYTSYLELKREKNGELFDVFDAIICGDNPKIGKGKPAPDIFLVAAQAIGIAPEKCIAFEDSAAGVASAAAAGMRVVGIPDSRLPKEQFSAAEVLLTSLTEFDATAFGFPAMPAAAVEASTADATGAGTSGGDEA